MQSQATVSGEVPRDIAALPEVMRLVERFFAASAADPAVRYPIELAVEEVFTNFVKYNASGRGGIRIDLGLEEKDIVVRLTDFDTPRFDLVADAPPVDVNAPLEKRTAGGLGIYLVKKMMDRIEYSHRNRTGTVTLHKRAN
jgi:anti-sigma regulatory factor (Ser/Thr protein kinase)